jgi:hypothetical protein
MICPSMFNVHPGFLIVTVVIVVVIFGPIVAVVWAVSRSARSQPSPANPQLSPDGKWWWDGQRWVPTQQNPPS